MAETSKAISLDARNIHAPLWAVMAGGLTFGVTMISCGLWVGINVTGTRTTADRIAADLLKRPTLAEMQTATVQAVRPLETSVAKMNEKLDMLDRRVQKLEDGK